MVVWEVDDHHSGRFLGEALLVHQSIRALPPRRICIPEDVQIAVEAFVTWDVLFVVGSQVMALAGLEHCLVWMWCEGTEDGWQTGSESPVQRRQILVAGDCWSEQPVLDECGNFEKDLKVGSLLVEDQGLTRCGP